MRYEKIGQRWHDRFWWWELQRNSTLLPLIFRYVFFTRVVGLPWRHAWLHKRSISVSVHFHSNLCSGSMVRSLVASSISGSPFPEHFQSSSAINFHSFALLHFLLLNGCELAEQFQSSSAVNFHSFYFNLLLLHCSSGFRATPGQFQNISIANFDQVFFFNYLLSINWRLIW